MSKKTFKKLGQNKKGENDTKESSLFFLFIGFFILRSIKDLYVLNWQSI